MPGFRGIFLQWAFDQTICTAMSGGKTYSAPYEKKEEEEVNEPNSDVSYSLRKGGERKRRSPKDRASRPDNLLHLLVG